LVAFIVISFDVMSLGLLIFHFMHNIAALDLPCPLLSSNIFPVHLRKHFQETSHASYFSHLKPDWLPISIRYQYGINTDFIRIDSVLIPY